MSRYIALCALLVACGGGDHDTDVVVDGGNVTNGNVTSGNVTSGGSNTNVSFGNGTSGETRISVCSGACSGSIEGDGKLVNDPRDVRGFDAITNELPLSVVVTQGDFKVEVSWDGNLVGKILTVIEDGTLYLRVAPGSSISSRQRGSIAIALPTLRALRNEGSGDVTVSGSAENVELSNDGSGDLDARNFTAARGTLENDGSGDVIATFTADVRISASGSGNVDLYGGATVSEDDTGSGAIKVH